MSTSHQSLSPHNNKENISLNLSSVHSGSSSNQKRAAIHQTKEMIEKSKALRQSLREVPSSARQSLGSSKRSVHAKSTGCLSSRGPLTQRPSTSASHRLSTPAIYSTTHSAPYNGSFHQFSKRYKVQRSSNYGNNRNYKPKPSTVEIHNDPIPNYNKKVKRTVHSRKIRKTKSMSNVHIDNTPLPNYSKKIKSVYDGTHCISKPKPSSVQIHNEPIVDYNKKVKPTVPSHRVHKKRRRSRSVPRPERLSLDGVKPTVPSHIVTHRPRPSSSLIYDEKNLTRKIMKKVKPTVPSHRVTHKPKSSTVNPVMNHCYRDELGDLYAGVERDTI